jgi:hypothetical protein
LVPGLEAVLLFVALGKARKGELVDVHAGTNIDAVLTS